MTNITYLNQINISHSILSTKLNSLICEHNTLNIVT